MREMQYDDLEYIDNEVHYTEMGRTGRRRKKRKNYVFLFFGLSGAFVLIVLIMYMGILFWEEKGGFGARDTVATLEQEMYTKAQLDEQVQIAVEEQSLAAATAKQTEILDGLRKSLESGMSTVEVLRNLYPEHIVLASGGKYHFVPIKEGLKKNSYDENCLNILENGEHQYLKEGQVVSYKGIDVSKHQGKIDWKKVAEDGVEFAFIRVALRGYETGKLVEDDRFKQNIEGAKKAGIKVGVYIYSQAISEEEVLEEAEFVLAKIAPYQLDCPVVYDVELVDGANGRMDVLTVEERTTLTALFCEAISNAGYKPMIYHNMEMGGLHINLEELEQYDKWFAYYNSDFYYPYAYQVWQYSDNGKVNGIDGEVDMNISFEPLWEE